MKKVFVKNCQVGPHRLRGKGEREKKKKPHHTETHIYPTLSFGKELYLSHSLSRCRQPH